MNADDCVPLRVEEIIAMGFSALKFYSQSMSVLDFPKPFARSDYKDVATLRDISPEACGRRKRARLVTPPIISELMI